MSREIDQVPGDDRPSATGVIGIIVFPAVGGVAPVTPRVAADVTGFDHHLASELAGVTGLAVTLAPMEHEQRPLAAGASFVRSDGVRLAIWLPEAMASGLVNHRCGGTFAPSDTTGSSGPASVRRLRGQLHAAILRGADRTWTCADPTWQCTVDGGRGLQSFATAVAIAGHSFPLFFEMTSAPPVGTIDAEPHDAGGWSRALAGAVGTIEFPLRAVLHQRPMRLTEAVALRPGDILPIDALRDVSLRIGSRHLARGIIAPDGCGGHAVTIVDPARIGLSPPSFQQEPS